MRKRIVSLILSLVSAVPILTACDDGKIYEEEVVVEREGSTVALTAQVNGVGSWSGDYNLVFAGFEDGNEYAQLARGLSASSDGAVSLVMSGVTANIDRLEICVINRLRKRIVSFYEVDFEESSDTIRLDAGTLNVGMFNGVQESVFNLYCVNCHGASTTAAAGLYLTSGQSYSHLVNVPAATSDEGKLLVVPNDADNSFLMDVLEDGASAHYHTDILSGSPDKISLLRDWIDAGATE